MLIRQDKNRSAFGRVAVLLAVAVVCALTVAFLYGCTSGTETDGTKDSGDPTVIESRDSEPPGGTAPAVPDTEPQDNTGTQDATDPGDDTDPTQTVEDDTGIDGAIEWTTASRYLTHNADDPDETRQEEVVYVELIDKDVSGFDSLTTKTLSVNGWSSPYGGSCSVIRENDDNACLKFTGIDQAWITPAFNLAGVITEPGTYTISFRYKLEGKGNPKGLLFRMVVRGTRTNSFLKTYGDNIFTDMGPGPGEYSDEWGTLSFKIAVSQSDLGAGDVWNFCLHEFDPSVSAIYLDDVQVFTAHRTVAEKIPTTAQTWVANEMVLCSSETYADPVRDCEIDLILTCGDVTLTVPGFWDGENVYCVRFALPVIGEWTWKTVCTNKSDTGLEGRSGTIVCSEYDGELAIYQHGFVTVGEGEKWFSYADGTPFLYIGDTHWNLPAEEYDSAGDRAGSLSSRITSHFKYEMQQRVKQGFTVIQSEPIDADFNVTNGITVSDIAGFQKFDKYFAYIAKLGLVHANAEFFYPSDMVNWQKEADFDEQLRVAARYWVARYGAYPVLWTLGQETDKNFYSQLDANNNPYKKLCAYISRYDPYGHPITAHMESTAYTKASDSAFVGVEGHNWFAAQWSPNLTDTVEFGTPKDFWNNSEGKPTILYESLYDHLWTNGFGARAEGWLGFLNGMFGYGYGVEDIWLYRSAYDIDTTSTNHGITVTPEDKAVLWSESIEFESAYQVGYMRDFFGNIEWWRLVPRFDDKAYFKVSRTALYSVASDGNDVYVLYFYNQTKATGTVSGMEPGAGYTSVWFNPRDGRFGDATTVVTDSGNFAIGDKPDTEDWVLLLIKNK